MNLDNGLILFALVVFQLLFIAFFLFTSKKGNRLSNVLLGLFFLLIGLNLLDLTLSIRGLYKYYAKFALLDDAFILAFGPLIYSYSKSVIYKDYRFSKKEFLHFLPYLIATITFFVGSMLQSGEAQKSLLDDIQTYSLPVWLMAVFSAIFLHPFVYLLLCYQQLRKYKQEILQSFSDIQRVSLGWLSFMINSLTVIWVISFLNALLPLTIFIEYLQFTIVFFIVFIFYFVNKVILKALNQPKLFDGISQSDEKYADSRLTVEENENYKNRLINLMNNEKPYLEPEININLLAGKLEIPSKTLSQVINQSFQKNFFDFINEYRVGEAVNLFRNTEDDKLTVLEVVYKSGFNSKSSFNTFFKKINGVTPTEFRDSIQK